MAYKFQMGDARLSGSVRQEGTIRADQKISSSADLYGLQLRTGGTVRIDSAGALSNISTISQTGGTVTLDGVVDAAINLGNDSFYYRDNDDNGRMKRDTVADVMGLVAGDGLAASSGVLSVSVDDSGIEINSDTLRLKDNGVTLAKMAGITRGSIILGDASGDPSLLAKGTAAQFLQSDGTDPSYVSISGDATVAAGGALTIANDAVESGMLNDNVISGQTELAADGLAAADEMMISDGGTLKKIGVDTLFTDGPGLLGAAAVDVAADHFMFLDGGATGDAKTESVADLMTAIAGAGLKSDADVLEVRVSGSIVRSSDKLGISGSIAGAGLGYGGGVNSINALSVNVDDSSIEVNSDALRVKAAGITDAMLNDDVATGLAGVGLSAASGVMALDLNELDAEAIASGDFLAFVDSTDNGTHKETVDDLATLFAGDGLSASSAVLAVNVDDSSIETNSDALRVKALGVTNAMLAGSIADSKLLQITTGDKVAGSAVQLAGTSAFEDSTGLRLKAATAGLGLSMTSQVMALDLNELQAEVIASGDFLAFVDSTDNGTHKESVDDLATLFAGNGLSAASAVMAVDLNELAAATVNVANDSIAIIDFDASNGSRKESIVDFVTAIAGAGLSATSGQLSVQGNAVASFGDEDATAAEGFNYGTATLTANRTVTLPAAPSVGDVVHIKAPPSLGGFNLIIAKAGTHTIDGATEVRIESGDGAVSLVYAVANKWKLF